MTSEDLKNRVKKLGFNLKDFSKIMNISYATTSKWGKTTPVPSWVSAFLDLYEENQNLQEIKKLIIQFAKGV